MKTIDDKIKRKIKQYADEKGLTHYPEEITSTYISTADIVSISMMKNPDHQYHTTDAYLVTIRKEGHTTDIYGVDIGAWDDPSDDYDYIFKYNRLTGEIEGHESYAPPTFNKEQWNKEAEEIIKNSREIARFSHEYEAEDYFSGSTETIINLTDYKSFYLNEKDGTILSEYDDNEYRTIDYTIWPPSIFLKEYKDDCERWKTCKALSDEDFRIIQELEKKEKENEMNAELKEKQEEILRFYDEKMFTEISTSGPYDSDNWPDDRADVIYADLEQAGFTEEEAEEILNSECSNAPVNKELWEKFLNHCSDLGIELEEEDDEITLS